ncbi:MAG TPA: transcription antitermination factor NusB [Actinomycetota bacterium]|nr:transcription antitermination factor NusB [Actinomycetota bacterium]
MSTGADGGSDVRAGTGHRRRRAARRAALDILYQADVTGAPPGDVLRGWRDAGREVPDYASELVAGVERDLPEIDAALGAHSEGWTVARMAAVDRTILRMAVYELRSGVPAPVAVNEAVEAAKELSTGASGGFVNGVLGRIAREDGTADSDADGA